MKNLIIIGAGGMGRVMYDMARESYGYGDIFEIKGFIDDNINALDNFENYPPMIGTIKDYEIQPDDIFICSIGGAFRRECMERIINKGGEFISLIHKTARIGTNVKLGKAIMVGAFTTIAADAVEFADDVFTRSRGHKYVLDFRRDFLVNRAIKSVGPRLFLFPQCYGYASDHVESPTKPA